MDSETESDTASEHSFDLEATQALVQSYHCPGSPMANGGRVEIAGAEEGRLYENDCPTIVEIRAAIQVIKDVDLDTVEEDTSAHDAIACASSTLESALDDVDVPRAIVAVLCAVPFLRLLFAHRTAFHRIAASALPPNAPPSTVVCWVDALLAKIAPTIAYERPADPTSDFLQSQRYSDSLRAAAQLPDSWYDVSQALASSAMSPAARRLAVRLLYGAYVLGGDGPEDEGGEQASPPSDLLPALSAFIDYTDHERTINEPSEALATQHRTTCAMVFALYAAADQHTIGDILMRPRSLGRLLELAQAVIHRGEDTSIFQPCQQAMERPMAALLRDEVLLWCWRTWRDNRTAGFEIVIAMTAAWLKHVMRAEDMALMHKLIEQREACCAAMLYVLHHAAPLARIDALGLLDVAQKALFIVNTLCREHGLLPSQASDMCRVGLRLFVELKDEEEELRVKDAVIEMLALAEAEVLRGALEEVRDDMKLRFPNRVDEAISRSRRLIPNPGAPFPDDPALLRPVVTTLQLLALIWHSEARGCLIRYPAAHLLCILVERLASAPVVAPATVLLAEATYAALAATERAQPGEDEAETAVWALGARLGRESVGVSGAFAQYILASKRMPSPLACAQAADVLRDGLLLVLRKHFLGEEEPLALLIVPSLCMALMKLTSASERLGAPSGPDE
ncbi:hypothetical protein HDZ31DRAFT_59629 [Schizophyllum fasciatum]